MSFLLLLCPFVRICPLVRIINKLSRRRRLKLRVHIKHEWQKKSWFSTLWYVHKSQCRNSAKFREINFCTDNPYWWFVTWFHKIFQVFVFSTLSLSFQNITWNRFLLTESLGYLLVYKVILQKHSVKTSKKPVCA